MKVPIDQQACFNLDAPTLSTYQTEAEGAVYWFVWCKHCEVYHCHGPAEGHREAKCMDSVSPYYFAGYNLAYAGQMEKPYRE